MSSRHIPTWKCPEGVGVIRGSMFMYFSGEVMSCNVCSLQCAKKRNRPLRHSLTSQKQCLHKQSLYLQRPENTQKQNSLPMHRSTTVHCCSSLWEIWVSPGGHISHNDPTQTFQFQWNITLYNGHLSWGFSLAASTHEALSWLSAHGPMSCSCSRRAATSSAWKPRDQKWDLGKKRSKWWWYSGDIVYGISWEHGF